MFKSTVASLPRLGEQRRSFVKTLILTALMLLAGLALVTPTRVAYSQTQDAEPASICDPSSPLSQYCLGGTRERANDSGSQILIDLGNTVISLLIYFAAPIAVAFVVVGGYKMTTSQGDAGQFKSGQTTVLNAILGLVVIFLSAGVISLAIIFITDIEL